MDNVKSLLSSTRPLLLNNTLAELTSADNEQNHHRVENKNELFRQRAHFHLCYALALSFPLSVKLDR